MKSNTFMLLLFINLALSPCVCGAGMFTVDSQASVLGARVTTSVVATAIRLETRAFQPQVEAKLNQDTNLGISREDLARFAHGKPTNYFLDNNMTLDYVSGDRLTPAAQRETHVWPMDNSSFAGRSYLLRPCAKLFYQELSFSPEERSGTWSLLVKKKDTIISFSMPILRKASSADVFTLRYQAKNDDLNLAMELYFVLTGVFS